MELGMLASSTAVSLLAVALKPVQII